VASRELPDKFLVAFSFAGEQRELIRPVAERLEQALGLSTVFFDDWFEHYIAGHDADLKLQEIYGMRSALVVMCVSGHYGEKLWTCAEYEAIRARLMKSRNSTARGERLGILPIRVGAGEVNGIESNVVVPDVRNRSPEEIASLIRERLRLILPRIEDQGPVRMRTQLQDQAPPNEPELIVKKIADFKAEKERIKEAIALYEKRIPLEERYDPERMVDLIRRHLSDEFGKSWILHLLVATYSERCVGMLSSYEDTENNFVFVGFMAARNPRVPGRNPPNISRHLAERLMQEHHRLGLDKPPRFLFEVDDPALARDGKERRRRLGRLKVFDRLAPFEGVHFRALDLRYLMPALEPPFTSGEKQLLLCYAAPGLGAALTKSEAVEVLTWMYTEVYGGRIFEDLATRAEFRKRNQALLDSVIRDLPERVRLLRYSEIEKR